MKYASLSLAVVLIAGLNQLVHALGPDTDRKETTRGELRAEVQEICPITGNKLGAHGKPIKAKIGRQELLLCCRGCLQGKKINPKHWATIHANFAKAQQICPVMKKKLPKRPKWTVVEGCIVYVCCPPCTKKIETSPKTYLKKIDELYSASLKAKRETR